MKCITEGGRASVYAFMYNGCIYESAAATISLHATKAGAWRAMRHDMMRAAQEERDFAIQYGGKRMMRYKTLEDRSFSVQEYEVLP